MAERTNVCRLVVAINPLVILRMERLDNFGL